MKRLVPLLLLLVVICLPQMVSAAPSSMSLVRIMLDQQEIVSDVSPIIRNDRTLVPIRVISENLGAQVIWNSTGKTVTIQKQDELLGLKINSLTVVKNATSYTIDVAPIIHMGRTLVPLRFISEHLGIQVNWDSSTRTVTLQNPPPPPPVDPSAVISGLVQSIFVQKDQLVIRTTMDKPEVKVFFLQNPNRAVIDVVYTKPEELGEIIPVESLLIQGVRYSYFNNAPDTTRVVLDLADRVDVATKVRGNEIWLTLTPKIFKVVIDAGHGGTDPGGIGTTGYYEKDFNLDLTLRLAELLAANPRIQVILTRSEDQFLELGERAKIANEVSADLFISLHANKFTKSTVRGIETYYLKDDSKDLATAIHSVLLPITGFPDRGVKQGNFKVIRETNMPATLLEIGFLSNTEEEAQLKSPEFRQKVAEGIAQAIIQYLDFPQVPTNEVNE
jgi:N-acetylmuramoyl-L-alanine amidase